MVIAYLPLDWNEKLTSPAASRYTAATPTLLRWFNPYNKTRPYAAQVKPFNFMLWFHAKRALDRRFEEPVDQWYSRTRKPKPVAPYDRDPEAVLDQMLDRETGDPVSPEWLRSYADVLRAYHIHAETKFLNGRPADSGTTRRRHIFATVIESIGKEADNWEEDDVLGTDEDSIIDYGFSDADKARMLEAIARAPKRKLKTRAKVSTDTITGVLADPAKCSDRLLRQLYEGAVLVDEDAKAKATKEAETVAWLKAQASIEGKKALAARLEINVSNLIKVLEGGRKPSASLVSKIVDLTQD